MTGTPPSSTARRRRPLVLTAVSALAVVLISIASVAWPERTGSDALVESTSSLARNLGLVLVALAIPAVLVAAGALSAMLGRLPRPRLVRAALMTCLWGASVVFALAWVVITASAWLAAGFTAQDVRAKQQLAVMPTRVAAVAGVTGTHDAQLSGTDLASGHNLFVTADLDPQLTADQRLQTLAQISAVLTEHQSNDLRMLVEARIGELAVGVSADDRLNSYRLRLASKLAAATTADLVVVSWREQGDDLITDDGRGVQVLLHSASQDPDRLAAAAAPVVRANATEGNITAVRLAPGTPPPAHYSAASRSLGIVIRQVTVTVQHQAG